MLNGSFSVAINVLEFDGYLPRDLVSNKRCHSRFVCVQKMDLNIFAQHTLDSS